jgi:flavin reductase (DIM6/NTAB) family NADH-FMN oxidoreductase RutF
MNTEKFIKIDPSEIERNIFRLISDDWFLLSAGNLLQFNTMTANWGGLGHLWRKDVAFCFVRPQRYTYGFMEANSYFSMSFFGEEFREALTICGKESGRDIDKMERTGLTPFASPEGSVFYEQASLLLECRKLYYSDLEPNHFVDPAIIRNYPGNDFHRMYVGEIISCFTKQ